MFTIWILPLIINLILLRMYVAQMLKESDKITTDNIKMLSMFFILGLIPFLNIAVMLGLIMIYLVVVKDISLTQFIKFVFFIKDKKEDKDNNKYNKK